MQRASESRELGENKWKEDDVPINQHGKCLGSRSCCTLNCPTRSAFSFINLYLVLFLCYLSNIHAHTFC